MPALRISQLADATGFPTATLRYYETIGLLTPSRDPNGYRRYDQSHVERLRFVGRAKQLGLQLDQIGELLELRGDGNCPPVRSKLATLVTEKLTQTRHSITELNQFADELAVLADRIAGSDAPPVCGEGCGCPDHPLELATGLEIACTLPAGERGERAADWRALAEAADRVEPTEAGWRLHLPDTPEMAARTAELAAAERRCCAFLSFTLTLADNALLLDVTAPDDARALVDQLLTLSSSPAAVAATGG
jgi:DNA-binding transcriptional MerR regulator